MPRRLVVLGTSGLALETAQVARAADPGGERWTLAGFVGPVVDTGGRVSVAEPILGDDDWLLAQDGEWDLAIAVGVPRVREILAKRYGGDQRFRFPNILHPASFVEEGMVTFGEGNIMTAFVTCTANIVVGSFNHLNLMGGSISHDARFGDYCVINPGVNISGAVHIGDRVLVGTGAQVLENLDVGNDATVGAGAVVVKDVEPGTTVVGIPAKPLARR
jgi:sugar O-acyltransferase (sialic acid O-acetyltransferase NeuD family)